MDCRQNLNAIDHIICKDRDLLQSEEWLNKLFEDVLSKVPVAKKQSLIEVRDDMLKARNKCLSMVDVKRLGKKESASFGESELEYIFREEFNQHGCIRTWFNTMEYALNSYIDMEEYFVIPSGDEFINTLKDLIGKEDYPYQIEVKQVNEGEETGGYKVVSQLFTIYFPKSGPKYAKNDKYEYHYFAGHAHGDSNRSSQIIMLEKNSDFTAKNFTGGAYSCSIALKEPVIINNILYFPEEKSFDEVFGKIFGKHSTFRPYVVSYTYAPDCLEILRPYKGNKNISYLVFTKYYISNIIEDEVISSAQLPAIFAIFKKYAEEVNYIGPAVDSREAEDFEEDGNIFIFIKEDNIEKLKQELLLYSETKH